MLLLKLWDKPSNLRSSLNSGCSDVATRFKESARGVVDFFSTTKHPGTKKERKIKHEISAALKEVEMRCIAFLFWIIGYSQRIGFDRIVFKHPAFSARFFNQTNIGDAHLPVQ